MDEFKIDTTGPTVLLSTANSYSSFKSNWNTESPQINITSSEAGSITMKDKDDTAVTITAPAAVNGEHPIAANTDTSITFPAAEGTYAAGDLIITITDQAGNTTDFDIPAFATDVSDPTVSSTDISSNRVVDGANVPKTDLKAGDIITITIVASEELHIAAANNQIIFNAGQNDSNVNLAATTNTNEYSASYTIASGDDGTPKYKVKLTDLAGNSATDAAYTNITSVDIRTTKPTISGVGNGSIIW